jgi:hypothetical protein
MYDDHIRAEAARILASGATISGASRELHISRSTIREWATRPRTVGVCPAPQPANPAYSKLLGYYLGDGCISEQPRTHSLRVACDASLPGIVDDVESCIRLVHPRRRTYRVKAPGTIVVQSYWTHWPCLFPQHGSGRKHERELGMQPWQWEAVEAHPAEFLRGLFHSDGSLVKNRATRMVAGEMKRYEYPRWQFVNESGDIMRWCGEALDIVGVAWRQSNRRTLSVSRRDDVARLTALIGVGS